MSRIALFAACLAHGLFLAPVEADEYEVAVKLETPRKKPPRMGGPTDVAQFKLWIPDDVETVRGAVMNPFYVPATGQKHWRAACRHWNFALIGANLAGVKKSELHQTTVEALRQLAEESGHPEVEHMPLCFVGMSAGGGMSITMAQFFPERTLACGPVCLEVGPRDEATVPIPTVTVFGERDGRQKDKLLEKLPTQRGLGARWAIAVQWGRRHEFGQANNIIYPFFDAVIKQRLPDNAAATEGPVELAPFPVEAGVSVPVETWGTLGIEPVEAAAIESPTCWFPNRDVAETWLAFTTKSRKLRITEPTGLGDGQEFAIRTAGEPLTVTTKGCSGGTLRLMTGTVSQAHTSEPPYSFTIILPAGIHALHLVREENGKVVELSRPNTIVVLEQE